MTNSYEILRCPLDPATPDNPFHCPQSRLLAGACPHAGCDCGQDIVVTLASPHNQITLLTFVSGTEGLVLPQDVFHDIEVANSCSHCANLWYYVDKTEVLRLKYRLQS